jgi:hypothetical protein
MQVQRHVQQPVRSTAQDSAQFFPVVIQSPGLQIKQGKCTFGKITGTGKSQVDSGNFVSDVHSGSIEQEGSAYEDIQAEDEARMRQGNYVNGNKDISDNHDSG